MASTAPTGPDQPGIARPSSALAAVRGLAGALAEPLGAVARGGWHLLRRPLPTTRGELGLPGLQRDVEVVRDRWGVPHLYAATAHDLFFAQGCVHAQDRLWQMELQRRVAAGTLAEVVGELGLETDRFFRRIGLRRAAVAELAAMDEETRAAGAAYAAGVNAGLAAQRGRWPLELALLGAAPAPWTPLDSVTLAKLLGWALSCNWETELLRSHLLDRLGAERAAALEPAYPADHPVTTAPGLAAAAADGFVLAQFREAQRFLQGVGAGAASNAWAVGGARSATGRPLLANDPHLQPQLPCLWYEAHLSGAGFDVAGASIPGVPGIVVGHNARIAWGITMSLADTQDLYVERLNPADPRQYEHQGRWEEAALVREVIRVKGRREPVVEEVLVTRHGPIVTPLIPGERRALALRCASLDVGQPGRAILDLNRAGNWAEFRAALAHWGVSCLSFVYADVAGDVGYQLAGRVPRRAKGDGLAPAPGWSGEHEWLGYVPPAELPSALNPPSGYVVSANHRLVDDDYLHLISREWASGYRARRIGELLAAGERHDVASFRAIQADRLSLAARDFRPHLLATPPADAIATRALALVRDWDCRVEAASAPAALYEVWRHCLQRNVFGARLGDQLEHYLGLGHESLIRTNAYSARIGPHLLRLLAERPADWFEAPAAEPPSPLWPRSWDEALRASLREAVLLLRAALGDDPAAWRWGDLHRITFRHALGVGLLGRLLSRGPFPLGGDADCVCQAAVDVAAPFQATGASASYRQIVDLADLDRSVSVLPSGQSGQPASPHYFDMWELWRRGECHPAPFSRRAVLAAAAERLVLRPAGAPAGEAPARARRLGRESEVEP